MAIIVLLTFFMTSVRYDISYAAAYLKISLTFLSS